MTKPKKTEAEDFSASLLKPKRDANGRLLPGSTANPGGRPAWIKEVQAELESSTRAGLLLLQKVIEGQPMPTVFMGKKMMSIPSTADRLRAVEIAFSYSLVKPTAKVDLSVSQAPKWISETTKEEALKILEAAKELSDD